MFLSVFKYYRHIFLLFRFIMSIIRNISIHVFICCNHVIFIDKTAIFVYTEKHEKGTFIFTN